MALPPVSEDAVKATKYDVGTKVKYVVSNGSSWHSLYRMTTDLIVKWHNGRILKLESSDNGKK